MFLPWKEIAWQVVRNLVSRPQRTSTLLPSPPCRFPLADRQRLDNMSATPPPPPPPPRPAFGRGGGLPLPDAAGPHITPKVPHPSVIIRYSLGFPLMCLMLVRRASTRFGDNTFNLLLRKMQIACCFLETKCAQNQNGLIKYIGSSRWLTFWHFPISIQHTSPAGMGQTIQEVSSSFRGPSGILLTQFNGI